MTSKILDQKLNKYMSNEIQSYLLPPLIRKSDYLKQLIYLTNNVKNKIDYNYCSNLAGTRAEQGLHDTKIIKVDDWWTVRRKY